MLVELFLLIFTALFGYYFYVYIKIHRYFDKHGIKYCAGVPVFGNIFNSTFLRRHIIQDLDAVYKTFPDEKYVGFVEGTKPLILIRDPELMKMITVKDFDHFMNRKPFFPEEIAPLLGSSLIMMQDENWREMRSRLSPSFTSSKMKHMVPFIAEISNKILEYLKDHQLEDIDVEDLMRRYTNDATVSTMLGLEVNSIENCDNIFFKTGDENVCFTLKKRICYFLALQSPSLAKIMQFLKIGIQSMDGVNFFRDVVFRNIEHRKQNNIIRRDLIHSLVEASKEAVSNSGTPKRDPDEDLISNSKGSLTSLTEYKEWTPDEIAGQAYFAFLASFETSSSTLAMCIHELAINPDIQEILFEEIKDIKEANKELTFEDINQLKYLDCVLNETSRKWSSAMMMDRICTKSYVLPPPRRGGKPYRVTPGEMVYNVVNPIHMDPKYHPNPEVFNPDRFSDENKHKIEPFTFMPFGMGPRNCLGMRFAILQMKVILYFLILHFKIIRCPKTSVPMHLMANVISVKAIGGTWVQFQCRK